MASKNGNWMRFYDDEDNHALNTGGKTAQGVKAFRQSTYTPGGQRLAGSTLGSDAMDYGSVKRPRPEG